jgi:hypothetical protein
MRALKRLAVAAGIALLSGAATAAPYYYVDWQTINAGAGTASGTITLPDASTVTVGFEAINPDGSAGSFFFGQAGCGTNYWNPDTPYVSPQVDNSPPNCELLALVGGVNQTYHVSLSEPIKDPIMAIVSLGRPGSDTTYDFDSPFTIVSQGVGFWGGGPTALEALPGNILEGNEGHGTIQFIGTFDSFSWTVPTPENWHGFTFAIRTTPRIEPPIGTIPEPTTLALLAIGIAGFAATRRRAA